MRGVRCDPANRVIEAKLSKMLMVGYKYGGVFYVLWIDNHQSRHLEIRGTPQSMLRQVNWTCRLHHSV